MTKRPALLLLAAAIAWFAFSAWNMRFVQDDSYITLSYARNLVDGHGLVFNPGEAVEGITSLLWTLIAAAAHLLSRDPMPILQVLGLLCGAGAMIFVYRITDALTPDDTSVWKALPAAVLGCTSAFQYWSVSAMETSLFLLVVAVAVDAYIRQPRSWAWAVWMGIALLTRPEAMLVAVVLAADTLWRDGPGRTTLRNIAIMAGTLIALTSWRYATYGALLPNTFAAKTTSPAEQIGAGLDYVLLFLNGAGGYVLLAGAIASLVLLRGRAIVMLAALVLLWTAAVTALGGDVLRHQRFLLPVAMLSGPLLYAVLRHVMERFRVKSGSYVTAGILVVLCIWVARAETSKIEATMTMEGKLVHKMTMTGKWLKNFAQANGRPVSVAATTIGALKWYSNQTVIDMLGLTDRTIATRPETIPEISDDRTVHWKERKYNASYVLSRKPDFILFSTGLKPSAFAERALFARESYVDYYYYYYSVPESENLQVMLRRKPVQVLRKSPQHKLGLTHDQIMALGTYPQALMVLDSPTEPHAAERLFRDLTVQGPPNFSTPWQYLGYITQSRGALDTAATLYLQALRTDPCDMRSRLALTQIYLAVQDSASSRDHAEWLRRCNPVLLNLVQGYSVPEGVY